MTSNDTSVPGRPRHLHGALDRRERRRPERGGDPGQVQEVIPLQAVIDAYVEQLHFAEDQGAGVVLMASRHLARAASSPADYAHVYREVLARAGAPVVLHWLGAAFDPQLAGYFGSDDVATCIDTVVEIMAENADRVRGIKMSLLDAGHEITVRSRLPHGTRLFTGDDYHYVDLIAGDGERHSDALLGAFACVAPNASAAIQALDAGDPAAYRRILGPTEALARHVFAAPTWFYKTGVAFLSWLNGHQPAFTMVGGLHAGAQPAAPVDARAAGRRGRGAGTARARRRAVERLPRAARRPGGSPRMTAPAVAEPGDDQVRRPAHRTARDPRGGHRRHRAVAGAGRRGRARRPPRRWWPTGSRRSRPTPCSPGG